MKIVHIETLINTGSFSKSSFWISTRKQIIKEIELIDWPTGSGSFSIHPESGKGRGKGNGVKPIKDSFVLRLIAEGWNKETPLDIATRVQPGKIDLTKKSNGFTVAVEWETGNISSSHRAINKMALGIIKNVLNAGILIVPSRNLYKFLTDRIGNFAELEPYVDLWKSLNIKDGVLEIIVVEHEIEDTKVPRIPKGTDGRAMQ